MVMRANNACATLLAALSLMLWHTAGERRIARRLAAAMGWVAALIGGLTSLEDLTGVNLRLDEWLAPGTFPGDRGNAFVVAPGRMSLNAALSLLLLGLALTGLDASVRSGGTRRRFLAPIFALLGAMPAACGLVGYLLGSGSFTGLLRSTRILWHAAASLLLLALGVLAARPHRPPVSRIFSTGAGGTLLRWLLPGSTALLLILGWAITEARAAGLVAPGEGTALMLFGGLVLLSALMVAASRAVARQEAMADASNAAHREEAERFHALAENISQLAWMTDETGAIVWYNRRWFDYTGTTFAEMQDWGWQKVHHPDHLERVVRKYRACLDRGEEWEDSFPLRGKDGEYRWFLSRARPIRDADDRITQWFGTNTDVTEQRDLTEQLARAKEQSEAAAHAVAEAAERFRFLAETVSLQVWTAQPTGELDFANQEVAKYFAADLDKEVLGNGWAQFVHPDDLPAALRTWQAALASGERYETEFRLRRHDGEQRWFLVRAQPMREGGRIVIWFGTNTDIHDLKTAQREAEAASHAKDDFLAALSHELRTPLTPVLLSATTLRHDERLPANLRAELAMMARNVQLEVRLIDDLLDLTRIVRGKLPLRTEQCDLHSLLGHSIEIVRDEARGKGVELALDLAAAHAGVTGDPARLQQVFWNLLRNAVKFTPAGGRIEVRSRNAETGEGLILEICDTGMGFEPEAAERLFRPFEQEPRAGHHRFGGLGLGLAIARAIVELHGGKIFAHSAGPNLGATFSVEMPGAFSPAADLGIGEPAAPDSLEPARPLHILLVDDHEPTLTVLTRLLRKAGHHIVGAGSIAAALAAHEAGTFDLLISDLGLPDGSGLELIEKLRARDATLRGIALSGYGMEEDLLRSREVGFIAHLVKPIDFEQLTHVLRKLP